MAGGMTVNLGCVSEKKLPEPPVVENLALVWPQVRDASQQCGLSAAAFSLQHNDVSCDFDHVNLCHELGAVTMDANHS